MIAVYASISLPHPYWMRFPTSSEGLIIMRNSMTTRTRRLLVASGITAVAGLYVTIATMDGANWRPFTENVEQTAASTRDGFIDGADGALRWMLETEINPATILIGFVAWLTLAAIIRRANRAWGLTGHAAKALKSNGSKATARWSGIALGTLLVLGTLGIGTAYAGVALGENFKPEVVAAYESTEKTVGGWFDNEEPKAAPAIPAAPTGNTDDEPADSGATATGQPEAPATPADEPRTGTETDKRTEAPADTRRDAEADKPVTEFGTELMAHGDKFVNDPAKWIKDNPLAFAVIVFVLLLWLLRVVYAVRRNASMRSELAYLGDLVDKQYDQLTSLRSQIGAKDVDGTVLHSIATLDGYVREDDRRLTALETQSRRNNGGDKRVAGGPTTV